MATKSTYGYSIIQDGDRGSEFCPLLSANWERMDAHKHDGVDSAKIKTSNLEKAAINLDFSGWVVDGDDYVQTVNLPSGYSFDETALRFVCASGTHTGKVLNLRTTKVSSSQFKVYCSFNDFNVKVLLI